MYELVKVTECAYYIDCPAKMGIIKTGEREVFFIDSGNNRDAAKKALKILNGEGWTLKGIINTHSHADHIGGNKYLQNNTACPAYAKGIEQAFTRFPLLEPISVWGAMPPAELCHKFLLAEESECSPTTPDLLPEGFKIIDLPGHTPDMVGIMTPDGAFFIADCLSSAETLDKYKIGFIYDVGTYLHTLEELKNMTAEVFIPSHAEPVKDIVPLAQYNIDKVGEVAEKILSLLSEPLCFEELLKALFDEYSLALSYEQYALVGSTLRSYLVYLKGKGLVEGIVEKNKLLWKKK